jgi:DNA-binding response OmpR family regulator
VLLIDDDEALGTLLTEYLGQFSFSVKAVAHPDEGLRALNADPPDIVVLDVMLPGMDGFAVCRKVRETSRVPIVMLTARGDVMDRIAGSSWAPTTTCRSPSSRASWWLGSRRCCAGAPVPTSGSPRGWGRWR